MAANKQTQHTYLLTSQAPGASSVYIAAQDWYFTSKSYKIICLQFTEIVVLNLQYINCVFQQQAVKHITSKA